MALKYKRKSHAPNPNPSPSPTEASAVGAGVSEQQETIINNVTAPARILIYTQRSFRSSFLIGMIGQFPIDILIGVGVLIVLYCLCENDAHVD
jgi:hypothetical protein